MTYDLEDAANELELAGGPPGIADMLRRIELERADAARHALEQAAKALEAFSANPVYKQALKVGARLVRDLRAKI